MLAPSQLATVQGGMCDMIRLWVLYSCLAFASLAAQAEDTGRALMAAAAAAGHLDQVRDLIAAGAHLDARGPAGRTALIDAAASGNPTDGASAAARGGSGRSDQEGGQGRRADTLIRRNRSIWAAYARAAILLSSSVHQ
jgi:Ankyrin repeats (many copies)